MTDPSGTEPEPAPEPVPEPAPEQRRLLEQLRQALGADPPPDGLVERAEGLLAFAGLDRELAELLDPAAAEPAGVRGPAEAGERLLFEVAGGSVTVELAVGWERLDGQVLTGAPAEVALERLDGQVHTTAVDELGRFVLPAVAAGPARLRLTGGTDRPVVTDWFLI